MHIVAVFRIFLMQIHRIAFLQSYRFHQHNPRPRQVPFDVALMLKQYVCKQNSSFQNKDRYKNNPLHLIQTVLPAHCRVLPRQLRLLLNYPHVFLNELCPL